MIQNGEVIYSADQIRVPAELPDILKNYTKFILKNQPTDILAASAEYFSQLSKTGGNGLANKELSDTQLEGVFLLFQGGNDTVDRASIIQSCQKAGISQQKCDDCLALGSWTTEIPWLKFWALLVASTRSSLSATVERVAQLIAGGLKTVAAQPVFAILDFLAERDPSVNKAGISAAKKALADGENSNVIQVEHIGAILNKNLSK